MNFEIAENDFIDRLKGNDQEAFEQLYLDYRHRIYKMAYRFSRDPFFADDVCQETMFRIYEGVNKMKGDSKLSTWIYKIAYNTSLELLRKNRRHAYEELDEEREALPGNDTVGKYDDLDIVLSKLKTKEKNILILFYIDNFSISELSKIMGISEGNAKVLLCRARKKAGEVANELQRI